MSYPGSKGQAGTWQRIIGQMPPHTVYIEPFAGSAQVFLRKRPARLNILTDLDAGVIHKLRKAPDHIGFVVDALTWLRYPQLPGDIGLTFGRDTVIYCDPPYLLSTRAGRSYYQHEFTDQDHATLLALLQVLKCRVLLSGYPSELYSSNLRGWRCIEYDAMTRGGKRRECLWCNFPEPDELHDWRFAGFNFRQRFGMKRFVTRWLDRIERMPARRRGYVLHELQSKISQRRPRRQDPQRTTTPPLALAAAPRMQQQSAGVPK
jgi:DNA adenine methylase